MQALSERVFTGMLWVLSGAGFQALVNVLVLVVLARLLTPREFGIVSAAMVVVGVSRVFGQMGVGPAVVQRRALDQRHVSAAFTISLVLGVLVGLVVLISAEPIARLFRIPELEDILPVFALVFPISSLAVVSEAMTQRQMRYDMIAVFGALSFLVGYGAVGIGLALAGAGVWALVIAQIAHAAVYASLLLIAQPRSVGISFSRRELGELLRFGYGASIARLANYAALQLDNIVVGRWLGTDALGIYSRAYQLVMVPTNLIGNMADRVLFPAMSSVQMDASRLERGHSHAISAIVMLAIPLSGTWIVLGPEIVSVLFGSQWDEMVLPLQVLAGFTALRASYKVSLALARAKGAVYRVAWRQLLYAAAVFFGAWVGQFYGLLGVAVGVGCAITVNFLLMLQLTFSLTASLWIQTLRAFLRHAGAAAPIVAAVWATKRFMVSYDMAPFWVLAGGLTAAIATVAGVASVVPQWFGVEGQWLRERIHAYIRYSRESRARLNHNRIEEQTNESTIQD
jgi:PST family polysaccharide transporter